MKKIFYWSPFLSNVATIGNVLNSAYSLSKYEKNSFNTYIIDVLGEWNDKKKDLLKKNINYIKLGKINVRFSISGFIKSRVLSFFLFIASVSPLYFLLKKEKPDYLIIHLLTSIPLVLLIFFNFKTKFILRISGLPRFNFLRKFLWKKISKKISLVTCPSQETMDYIKEAKIFNENKIAIVHDPIIDTSVILKKKKI